MIATTTPAIAPDTARELASDGMDVFDGAMDERIIEEDLSMVIDNDEEDRWIVFDMVNEVVLDDDWERLLLDVGITDDVIVTDDVMIVDDVVDTVDNKH
jgi:hypothetical protein